MSQDIVKVFCPDCGTWVCMVGTETTGRIAPYCKRCKENKIIKLSANVPDQEEAKPL